MMKSIFGNIFFIFIIFNTSCQSHYTATSLLYKDYKISNKGGDEKLKTLLKPYADSVHKSMNDVIAMADITMDKKLPESLLGNLMADIMLYKAKELYITNVDGAIVNYGGIRLPVLSKGPITRGKVFELSPFDNIIVLQILSGSVLQDLLDHIASKKGWPLAGITMQIKDKKAINVTVNGKPIDSNKNYTIALLDYVANGGDDASMLKGIRQINNGFIYRDAILDYFLKATSNGQTISSKIENRVTYAD